ncbi:DMT family transporter [Mannheimia varigena]|uniref:DMT family transporter n=1 Tax=Mannheimia varigena TaxID=85404 RepID=UPI001BB1E1B8|nr:DMT family transporter [Mannheimia varigena]
MGDIFHFGVGPGLTFLLMLFFAARNAPSFFAQPSWQLTGGILGVALYFIYQSSCSNNKKI